MTNKQRVALLVDALRSGKYEQTSGTLKHENRYCCLGVACELFRLENPAYQWIPSQSGYDIFIDSNATMPLTVYSWYGFTEPNPQLRKYPPTEDDGMSEWSMAGRNDFGATFNEIADALEMEYLK